MNTQALRNPIPRSPTDEGGAPPADAPPVDAAPPADAPPADAPPEAEWYAGLPDDLKGQPGVTRHATLTDAINAGIAAEKRLGVPANQLLRLPKDDKDTEGLQAIYKALGAPETADGYKINLEGASDDDKAMATEFATFMHAKGPFPPDALAASAEFWWGKVQAQAAADVEADKAAEAASIETLKTEWGAAFEQTKTEIGTLIVDLGGKELVEELKVDTLVGNNPHLARFLKKVVDSRAESGPGADGQQADVGQREIAPGVARSMIAELEGDPVKGVALRDDSHPQHKAVVAERSKLLRAANPGFKQHAS